MKFLNLIIVLFVFYNFGGSSSSSCGELRNITYYPYYLPGACKWKAYELQCDGNDTVLYIAATKYLVKDISIENKTLRLVDPDLAVGGCRLPNQTLNWEQYGNDLFSLYSTSYDVSLIYFFNCTGEVKDSMYKLIHCMGMPHSRVYARLISYAEVGSTPKSCRYVGRTVANSEVQKRWNDSDGVDMMQMLGRGLVVSWDLSSDYPPSYYWEYYNQRCSVLHYCWSSTTSGFMDTMRSDYTVNKLLDLLFIQLKFLVCIYPQGVGTYPNPGADFGFMLVLLALFDILLVLLVLRLTVLPLAILSFLLHKYK